MTCGTYMLQHAGTKILLRVHFWREFLLLLRLCGEPILLRVLLWLLLAVKCMYMCVHTGTVVLHVVCSILNDSNESTHFTHSLFSRVPIAVCTFLHPHTNIHNSSTHNPSNNQKSRGDQRHGTGLQVMTSAFYIRRSGWSRGAWRGSRAAWRRCKSGWRRCKSGWRSTSFDECDRLGDIHLVRGATRPTNGIQRETFTAQRTGEDGWWPSDCVDTLFVVANGWTCTLHFGRTFFILEEVNHAQPRTTLVGGHVELVLGVLCPAGDWDIVVDDAFGWVRIFVVRDAHRTKGISFVDQGQVSRIARWVTVGRDEQELQECETEHVFYQLGSYFWIVK